MKKKKKELGGRFKQKVEKYWWILALAIMVLGLYLIYLSTTV